MARQAITTDKAPKPGGHFAQAIAVEATGRLVFISGMVAQRPDGTIEGIGDIEAQTRQVCENIKAAWRRSIRCGVSIFPHRPPPPHWLR